MKALPHSRRGTAISAKRALTAWTCLALLVTVVGIDSPASAGVTPESPEVKRVVERALGFLEKNQDERFGAVCLSGLVFLKAGKPDHARVKEAIAACKKAVA